MRDVLCFPLFLCTSRQFPIRTAERTLAQTPSLDQIAERARQLVMEAVAIRLLEQRLSPA